MGEYNSKGFGNGLIRNHNFIPFIIIWVISYWHLLFFLAYKLSKDSLENALKLRSINDKLSFRKPAASTGIWSTHQLPSCVTSFPGRLQPSSNANTIFHNLSRLHLGTCMALGRKMFFLCEVSDDNHLHGKSACAGAAGRGLWQFHN